MSHNWRCELVVVQPTPFCNINCSYCYLKDRSDTRRMSQRTVEAIMSSVFESGFCAEQVSVVWHAGEPLVMPPEFYEQAFRMIDRLKPRGLSVVHHIQTNATLVNERWCELFRDWSVNVGVSIDGSEEIHNLHRQTRSGNGTFVQVMQGVRMLQSYSVPLSVIAVVTADTLSRAAAFHDFFVENRLMRVGINVEEIENAHVTSSLADIDRTEQFAEFISQLEQLSRLSGLSVREFERAESAIAQFVRSGTGPEVSPLYSLSFDVDGNFTAFAPELLGVTHPGYGDFKLGNVFDVSVDQAIRSSRFQQLNAGVAKGRAACKASCEYFGVCGGGSPANKLFENGSLESTETMYCRLQVKTVVPVVAHRLALGLNRPS